MASLKWNENISSRSKLKKVPLDDYCLEEVQNVRKFHESFEAYSKTPLVRLSQLSKALGVSEILVKDESYRFGLDAFKVLGGSYAIGRFLADKLELPTDDLTFDLLRTKEAKEKLGDLVFTTATDGNHGRGVAWAATQLGYKSVVYMPKGSSEQRLNSIRKAGAEASITNLNYDDAVRLSLENAKKNGWQIVQDTAWEGYNDIPRWIMQGYATMMLEAMEQYSEMKIEKPTHVFIQAGVGSLAGAIQGVLAAVYGDERPITTIVEPNKADCMYRSSLKNEIVNVTGDMDTIMAGLACGEPNPIGWGILNDYADMFVSCPEYITANGMRILGNPLKGDEKVISGESGAVTTGLVFSILKDKNLAELKEQLKIDENSRILVFSTEGDTDIESYYKVVWQGSYADETL